MLGYAKLGSANSLLSCEIRMACSDDLRKSCEFVLHTFLRHFLQDGAHLAKTFGRTFCGKKWAHWCNCRSRKLTSPAQKQCGYTNRPSQYAGDCCLRLAKR